MYIEIFKIPKKLFKITEFFNKCWLVWGTNFIVVEKGCIISIHSKCNNNYGPWRICRQGLTEFNMYALLMSNLCLFRNVKYIQCLHLIPTCT